MIFTSDELNEKGMTKQEELGSYRGWLWKTSLKMVPDYWLTGTGIDNFGNFLRAGCYGAGIGGTLCDRELIRNKEWHKLTNLAEQFCAIYQTHIST